MNPLMGQMAPQAPAQPQAPQFTPQQINEARSHGAAVVDGLRELVAKPRGQLTKEDVFSAAAGMISKGAFPSPQSKQQLITMLTQLPDDEPTLRNALGGLLLNGSANLAKLNEIHGPGDA